jgi:hypothetical protein
LPAPGKSIIAKNRDFAAGVKGHGREFLARREARRGDCSTDAGMATLGRDKHIVNAERPKTETFDPTSNVKHESHTQRLKQQSLMVSTDAGIRIDESEKHSAKVNWSRIEMLTPRWNFTVRRYLA